MPIDLDQENFRLIRIMPNTGHTLIKETILDFKENGGR